MRQTSDWGKRVRDFVQGWSSPFTAAVPDPIHAEMIRFQGARLHAILPRLCLCLAASAIAMAMAVLGDLPLWQQLAPPMIIVGTCLIVLYRSRIHPLRVDLPGLEIRLRAAMLVSIVLGLVAGLWAINAFNETEKYYCMVAPVFIGIAGLVCATCLINIPRAAIGAMVMSVVPIAAKMLLYPNLGVRAMAVMMVLITWLESDVVLAKFRETVAMLSLQDELNQLAKSDPLTGLENRRAFMHALQSLFECGGAPLVALADLDGFKAVNDSYGHHAGDEILVGVADRIQALAPSAISVARLGGDEFALLFDISNGEDQATHALAAIRTMVAMPFAYGEHMISVGISIGTATNSQASGDIAALMQAADTRLYVDKTGRRDQAAPDYFPAILTG